MIDVLAANQVAVAQHPAAVTYPSQRDVFSPDTNYPEYQGPLSAEPNLVYRLVRDALIQLELDAANLGTPNWNPLGDLIRPGQYVTLKPNWVLHKNKSEAGEDCLFTHAAIVRAVLDYVLLARPGKIVVGDAPLQGCDLDSLWRLGQYRLLMEYFRDKQPSIEWTDFRRTIRRQVAGQTVQIGGQRALDRFVLFDLKQNSHLEPIATDWKKFRVTQYDPKIMLRHHRPGLHKYLVAREVIDADVVINLPKLKTHMKAGLTGSLKNLVGINGHKEYLPHHRKGGSKNGGDCYEGYSIWKSMGEHLLDVANRRLDQPSGILHTLMRACNIPLRLRGQDTLREGAWHGNDTVWRMCLDLNQVLLYGRDDGSLADQPQRAVLHITDAIVAGENNGPLSPTPISLGTVTAGWNPVAVDYVHTHIMGFDWQKIPTIRHSFDPCLYRLADFLPQEVIVKFNGQSLRQPWPDLAPRTFTPAPGWQGHCENDHAVPTSLPAESMGSNGDAVAACSHEEIANRK